MMPMVVRIPPAACKLEKWPSWRLFMEVFMTLTFRNEENRELGSKDHPSDSANTVLGGARVPYWALGAVLCMYV